MKRGKRGDTVHAVAPSDASPPKKLIRVLSIDGGGIRGLIPGKILESLEAKLKSAAGPQATIADHFDLIAGTSTGGILACGLLAPDPEKPGRPRYSAEELVKMYVDHGDDIFHIPKLHTLASLSGLLEEKYPASGIERVLEKYFGDTELAELVGPALVTAYEIELRRTWFFVRPEDASKAEKVKLREVTRATSAAPTFFEPARVHSDGVQYAFVDGGVFANNPALCAFAEARKFEANPKASDLAILSLGTGEHKIPYEYEDAKRWGPIGWVHPILEIMMSGVAETVHYQLARIFESVERPAQYLRIQPELPKDATEMDNTSPENIQHLIKRGAEAARQHDAQLDAFVELLVAGTVPAAG